MSTLAPHRKRLRRVEIPDGVRYVTFSCEHRLALMGSAAIRDFVREALFDTRAQFGFELFAYVIMPEHVHVVAMPRNGVPLSRSLRAFKVSVAGRVVARWREHHAPILARITRPDGSVRFWLKGGGFDRNPRDTAEFAREVKYVHANPVERGLVRTPEEWAWSSVHCWAGRWKERQPFGCDRPPGDPRIWLRWKGYR
jgi:putative transposase